MHLRVSCYLFEQGLMGATGDPGLPGKQGDKVQRC